MKDVFGHEKGRRIEFGSRLCKGMVVEAGTYLVDMLKAAGVKYETHFYPGTQHGFHNNSTPRYQEAAAKLSWERTVGFFRKSLG